MIRWLDFAIFGSGWGLAAPATDQAFYWLIHTVKDTNKSWGTFYTWSGWFGCQLKSFQWTHPKPQERRIIKGYEFKPFDSTRTCGRVQVSWCLVDLPKGIDESNKVIRQLEKDICHG